MNMNTLDPWKSQPTLARLQEHDIWHLRRRFLETLLPDVRGLRVLEVGSGPAHDSITFVERGAEVTAFDRSEQGLEIARQIYADLRLPLSTACGDALSLPFDSGTFDITFNAGVLEHFVDEDLERVIDEMIRVTRPGGLVLAFCPNRLNFFYQTHLRRIAEHAYEFERAFTARELSACFEARGLGEVSVSGVHVHPAPNYLLPSWLPKHHRIEPLMRRCFRWLEHARGLDRLKSIIGQDFVVWSRVPERLGERRPIRNAGGPAVRAAG